MNANTAITHYEVIKNQNHRVSAIPAFNDNYFWLIDNGLTAFVVDPGDASPVINALEALNLTLEGILITHHHSDHVGGVEQLKNKYLATIYGPKSNNIPQVTDTVNEANTLSLLGMQTSIIEVPGHTLDHIAYFFDLQNPLDQPLLFCGDTLFAGGCGRVFEGSFTQMRRSLDKLKTLPNNTLIFCAHEYTQANLSFAKAVEPNNVFLLERIKQVNTLREKSQPTVPSTLLTELSSNPFLRYDQIDVIHKAEQRTNKNQLDADQVFAEIRRWKDNF